MMFALLAALLVQAPDAARIEAAILKAGERRYRLNEDGKPVGTLTLKSSVVTIDGRKSALFEDVFDVTLGGQKVQMATKEKALLDGLALVSTSRKGPFSENGGDWTIAVADKKATITVQGRTQTIDLVGPTIGEQAAIRMVCAAEQKKGVTFKLDVLNLGAEELHKGHTFACLAREDLEIGRKKVPAYKWTETYESKGVRDGIPTSTKVDNAYWVSPEGVLLRSTSSGRMEMMLESN
jgi:hypothetical protein